MNAGRGQRGTALERALFAFLAVVLVLGFGPSQAHAGQHGIHELSEAGPGLWAKHAPPAPAEDPSELLAEGEKEKEKETEDSDGDDSDDDLRQDDVGLALVDLLEPHSVHAARHAATIQRSLAQRVHAGIGARGPPV